MKLKIKMGIDLLMTALLLCLMAYQVTGQKLHEWFGTGMLVLFLLHNILNVQWYGSLFKGKYTLLRTMQMLINIIAQPNILLLDEPLTSLDVVVAEEMKQLLRSIKQDRITIFSTHIMDLALDLCDEIVLLSHGELEVVEKSDLDSREFKEKIIAALREEGNE